MPDFITLTCPSCGGKLQITDKISTFACGHCGNEHIVHREGGMVYLAPLAEDVRHIRTGVDKTAAELAVARLTKEVEILEAKLQSLVNRQTATKSNTGCVNAAGILFLLAIVALLAFGVLVVGPLWFLSLEPGARLPVGIGMLVVVLAALGVLMYMLSVKPKSAQKTPRPKAKTPLELEIEGVTAELNAKRAQLQKSHEIANS